MKAVTHVIFARLKTIAIRCLCNDVHVAFLYFVWLSIKPVHKRKRGRVAKCLLCVIFLIIDALHEKKYLTEIQECLNINFKVRLSNITGFSSIL